MGWKQGRGQSNVGRRGQGDCYGIWREKAKGRGLGFL